MTSQTGAISACIKEAHQQHQSMGLADFQKKVLVLGNKNSFSRDGGFEKHGLSPLPDKALLWEARGGPGRPHSLYHNGLLTSRILASHEVILLMYLVSHLEESRLGR